MSLYDTPIESLEGSPDLLNAQKGKLSLFVNVASKCGLTPQYEGLVKLQKSYADQGFDVVGFPCNQFLGQEPGTAEEIREFCSTTYGVDFPLSEKIDVNGDDRHPLYDQLTPTPYVGGEDGGDIKWNFEKFLVSPEGEIVARFAPTVEPEDDAIVSLIDANLPG
jgi:glutathione peroxidase